MANANKHWKLSAMPREMRDRSMLNLTMLATFCVLVVIICIGVLLAFTIGDTLKPTAVFGADHDSGEFADGTGGPTMTTADPVHQETVVPLLVLPMPTREQASAPGLLTSRLPKILSEQIVERLSDPLPSH
ncbi:uncharacterized protein LOC144095250 [Amblyomma americanum]